MRRRMPVAIAAGLSAIVAAPALVQNAGLAPAAAAAMRPQVKTSPDVTVKVINWRNSDLIELQAAVSGSTNWKKVLGALKAGQWTSANLPQGINCRVDLRGKYADGQSADVSNVEVCSDKTVNLTN